jgi:transcriptional regulator with XRE-family HTH domain
MTAAQLQRLLDQAGKSQRGMAKELGISERQMRRYCSGEHPVPRVIELAVRCLAQHHNQGNKS